MRNIKEHGSKEESGVIFSLFENFEWEYYKNRDR